MPAEKYRVELTAEERGELLAVVRRGKGGAAQVRRANILLAVDVGEHADLRMSEAEAARTYRASAKTVFSLKKKLAAEGFRGVLERKRRSSPGNLKIDGGVEAKIIALACTDAPEGHDHWTVRLLADKAVELGYVARKADRHVEQDFFDPAASVKNGRARFVSAQASQSKAPVL